MRDHAAFVAARRGEWDAARAALPRTLSQTPYADLEALAARHRAVLADYAWARSHFPGSEAERELRSLAFAGHRLLSPPEAPLGARVWAYLRDGYPARFRASLGHLGISLALFVGGLLAGLALTTLADGAAILFVGAEGVDLVRSGRIWTDSLEENQHPLVLAIRIFSNNIGVVLSTWAGGALFGLGTTFLVAYNGAMVGSMVAICMQYGVLDRLFAFIPAHGLLELFLVTVGGAAGFQLAEGLLRPGEEGRGASFAAAAGRSIELVAGTAPWLVLLGIVEGFLSPRMGVATETKLLVGVALLATFLLYTLPARSRP